MAPLDQAALADRTAALLRELIRIDTVNPPGAERPAQELLCRTLRSAGFECQLLGAESSRPNLLARLRGQADGPTFALLGHTDTVLANRQEWRHDPWSGVLADGFLWGRGAIDMKSQVAAETVAAATLASSGWRPARGELLLLAVADEETGGALGAQWLTREHPEKVRCDMLLNEGAGQHFHYRGTRRYGVCCAEKGVFRFTVRTSGAAAHASTPRVGENALLKLAPLLTRLAERQPSYVLTQQAREMLAALGESPSDPSAAIARFAQEDERLPALLEPVLAVSLTPTKASASQKINVIPSSAEIQVDCRVPPGLGEREVREAIAEVLGQERELGFAIEFTDTVQGNASPARSPLMQAISAWLAEADPAASLVPTVMPGFTDSRHFRNAFPECVAYGFFPQRHQSLLDVWPLLHGANERIDVRDLGFAAHCYSNLIIRLLGKGEIEPPPTVKLDTRDREAS
ncbi:MAG: M20/M25/M40 family metallo-hydrolase [Solirubrobacteraceae bacterium]